MYGVAGDAVDEVARDADSVRASGMDVFFESRDSSAIWMLCSLPRANLHL
jgi:hypothetical protein